KWNFTEDPDALLGVIEKPWSAVCAFAVACRLQRYDSHSVNLFVRVQADVGALVVPVERSAVAVAGERIDSFPGIVAAGAGPGHRTLRHDPVRVTFALVEARRTDQAKRRAFGQVLRALAVVGQAGQGLWLWNAVDSLIWHQGPRPALIVIRIVLDQSQLSGFF